MTHKLPLYRIITTKRYRKDAKRALKRGCHIRKLDVVIDTLAAGEMLPERYGNHKLTGDYAGYDECHIEPDWLLIYRRENDTLVLLLTRTGTHSDLFDL